MSETIYDRIQTRLKELNISEMKASIDAGLSKDAIRNIKRTGGTPRADNLNKLARILQVSPNWLLTGSEKLTIGEKKRSNVSGKVISEGLEPGFIPEIDTVLGAGGGGYPMPAVIADGIRSYEAETVRDQWRLPDRFLDELRVNLAFVDFVPVRGDSMAGTHGEGFFDGDRVLVNREEKMIRQGGIFAIREDNETLIKQVELVRDGEATDYPRIRCTSLNPRYKPFELVLDGESAEIIGRVVCRISRV